MLEERKSILWQTYNLNVSSTTMEYKTLYCRVVMISKSTFTAKSQKSGHISFCINSQITLLCWMDEIFYYLYLWWEISCIFYNTRLNTHMMEKCQIILTPINTIRHITINCEQFSWNVNCCLRQRKTSYDMICGHVNTKECLKRRKLNIVVSAGEVAHINEKSTFAHIVLILVWQTHFNW